MSRSSVVRWAAPLTTLVAAIIAGTLYGVQLAVLILAGGALLLVIWLLWSSVQALTGESELTFEEAFSLGARSAEEEQKRAVLRALKDLEYERSVGKISDEDYNEYATRYRTEAKRLIQGLEENLAEGRRQVETELARRLSRKSEKAKPSESAAAQTNGDSAPEETLDEATAEATSEPKVSAAPSRPCPACQVKNELDARFCKACGKSMAPAEESQS
ncbi:MAG TPA: zinc ribbon domain-containing protein [Polyangiaceae bacterium]|nr:zinc ribbon domain-containing protein [Polyangiaceae bacterium]